MAVARELYKPRLNEPCLCGSGQKFRGCCWGRLEGKDSGKAYRAAIKERNLGRALLACRADIVQYMVWHRTNTVPIMQSPRPMWDLLRIDVNAMGDLVDRLRMLYFALNRLEEFPEVLERLRDNIPWPAWHRKIAFFRAVYFLAPPPDFGRALSELQKAEPIAADDEDLDLVELKYDIGLENEPFSVRMKYIDRLVSDKGAVIEQLRYRGARAVQYFSIGDRETAKAELKSIIDELSDEDIELDGVEVFRLARLKKFYGQLTSDKAMIEQAKATFQSFLGEVKNEDIESLDTYRELGDCNKSLRLWSEAEVCYLESLFFQESAIDRVRLAESLIYQGKIGDACSEIDKVDEQGLDRNEREDFAFTWGTIAVFSEQYDRLMRAKTILTALKSTAPYFNERRLELLVSVSDTLAAGKASDTSKSASLPLAGALNAANSIIIVQPNIMGLGINFNALFDQLFKFRAANTNASEKPPQSSKLTKKKK